MFFGKQDRIESIKYLVELGNIYYSGGFFEKSVEFYLFTFNALSNWVESQETIDWTCLVLVNIAKAQKQLGNKKEMMAYTLKASSMVGQGMVVKEEIKKEVEKLNNAIHPKKNERSVRFTESCGEKSLIIMKRNGLNKSQFYAS
jgi:hypothetical protein